MSEKLIVIVRGLPCHQREERAKEITAFFKEKGMTAVMHTINSYFKHKVYSTEEYDRAIRTLRIKALNSMLAQIKAIIISQNNIKPWEYMGLIELSRIYGYNVYQEMVDCIAEKAISEAPYAITLDEAMSMARVLKTDSSLPEISQRYNIGRLSG